MTDKLLNKQEIFNYCKWEFTTILMLEGIWLVLRYGKR
jgi:hypothetical protein